MSVKIYHVLDVIHIEFFRFSSLLYTSIFAYKIESRDNFRYNGTTLEKTSNAAAARKSRQWAGKCNGNAKAIVYDVIHKAGKIREKESPKICVKFILASHSRKSDIMQQ